MTAQWDYTAQSQYELSFKAGDTIAVHQFDESGWWIGELGGQIGYFPGNYTKRQPAFTKKIDQSKAFYLSLFLLLSFVICISLLKVAPSILLLRQQLDLEHRLAAKDVRRLLATVVWSPYLTCIRSLRRSPLRSLRNNAPQSIRRPRGLPW